MDGKILLPNNKPQHTEKTDFIDSKNPKAQGSNEFLKQSGKVATPEGFDYVGSGAFHMYRSNKLHSDFAFIAVTPIGMASEGMCDVGWKRLRKALMDKFGRAAPKTRN